MERTCRCRKLKQKRRYELKEEKEEAKIYLNCKRGKVINRRYRVKNNIGEGSFGIVFKTWDCILKKSVALKVTKNPFKYLQYHEIKELQILLDLQTFDSKNKYNFIRMIDFFTAFGHLCTVFEMLDCDLNSLLRKYPRYPLDFEQIRHIFYQLCTSLQFLHSLNITHCDIKPENILLKHKKHKIQYSKKQRGYVKLLKDSKISICDFGLSCYNTDSHPTYIGTRDYAPPEITLELDWSNSFDVWSVACVIMELYNGYTLFRSDDNFESLAKLEMILGPCPKSMSRRTKLPYFDIHGELILPLEEIMYLNENEDLNKVKPLMQYKKVKNKSHNQLFRLIRNMLKYEPAKRITFGEAINRPFFAEL